MRYLILCVIVTLLSVPKVWGQRVVASVVPPAEESLKFDSNAVVLTTQGLGLGGDFSFSPNVVFTPDSLRGFVAYPGREEDGLTLASTKVLVFDAANGEVLELIEVGATPVSLTLTPDGEHLAVVSLFLRENTGSSENGFQPQMVGSISLIELRTLEVRTLELSDVLFSFFNNIVFSSDSSTGFVASAGTDEIIRFDVESMTERAPRLQLVSATRPASITIAPDGSFFTVVLPGSSILVTSEEPDSIQIIDPDSFSIVGSIVPDPLEIDLGDGNSFRIQHDFFGLNNVSITQDNKWAIIGDREISGASGLPVLASDHALIIDLELREVGQVIREVAQVINVGGGASASSVSPTGNLFALVSAIELSLIDPYEEGRRVISTGTSQFLESSRPTFAPDGRKVYVASPILDLINVYDVEKAITTEGIQVGQDFLRSSFNVPAGAMDLAFTSNGKILSVLNFNANNVELLKNTYRLTAPQMVADNIDHVLDDETEEPVPIPPSERFFSGIAVTNYGDQDAEVVMTALGFLSGPSTDFALLIDAVPNPVTVCEEGDFGQTTISWNVTGVLEGEAEIEVRTGSETGNLFAVGGLTGSAETGEWVTDGMIFVLLDRSSGDLLDTVTVTFTELGCPPPVIVVSPNPIQVCNDEGVGSTTVTWDATDIADEVEIRVDAVDGTLFTSGGPTGSHQTGLWVTEGMVFYLVDSSGNELDHEAVTLTDEGCPFALTEILRPDGQIALLADDFLSTDSSVDTSSVDFSGWVDLNSDEPSVSGIFLTFDGALSRIDGGPLSSETLDLAFLPEVRIRDGFTTQIDVVNPNNQGLGIIFDLFDSSGDLVASALQNVVPQGRISLPVLGNDETRGLGLFDNVTGFSRISASPNPIQVCDGERGQTTISWGVTGIAEEVEIRVGAVDGNLLADGAATGSAETGEWVTEGMVFYLLNRATGDLLDRVTVHLTELGCPPPVLVSSSNPIRVCDMGLGQTTISWDATDIADRVEIRLDSVDGSLFTSGGPTGSHQTGRWVTDGMTFYLLDETDGSQLDTETIRLTEEGCPLLDFEDGYIRAASRGTVTFETIIDPKRMAVLAAQPVYPEQTEFTIPHFVVFGGSDTILKLIHPSSLSVGGVSPDEGEEEEEGEEPEEQDPIVVSVSLRDDDGNAVAEPVELELPNGVSLRKSVRDLFGLVDRETIQSGWIEITTDIPGIVGSAEIQAFDGEALTAIPLQPVQNSKFVFSHVARGYGFSTGLAIVNSGSEPVTLVLELRNPDSELLGTVGPLTLAPGNRLVGLISQLFPESGELSGGTVKILSDAPVTGVELFYGDDLRVLSAVPPQRID